MFEGLYSNISQKYPKRRDLYDRKVLLEDFLRDEKEFNLKEVIKTFIKI